MALPRLFLLALALLYAAFALLCTLRPHPTARSLGYELVNAAGTCEFRTVYGGLECALAVFFALAAFRGGLEGGALWLAAILHVGLVAFRAPIILTSSGLGSTILGIFALEVLLATLGTVFAMRHGLP